MDLEKRINAFVQLGLIAELLAQHHQWPGYEHGLSRVDFEEFQAAMAQAEQKNPWFTNDHIRRSLHGISVLCKSENITAWLEKYRLPEGENPKTVALILAGNIPLVGFHDFMCVLLSGNTALVKLSAQDQILLPAIAGILASLAPGFESRIKFVTEGKLPPFDAVIATGSNNTARYFEYYFGKYPHIIRKNRSSVALLDGTESKDELRRLGDDIFLYFGLGCRNVSKIYMPESFELNRFFEAIIEFSQLSNHNKYINNYDYHKALWLLNNDELRDNGFLLLKEDSRLASPVGSLFYERYNTKAGVETLLATNADAVQCVVGHGYLPFGEAQNPKPWEYADGVDTMEFLLNLREE